VPCSYEIAVRLIHSFGCKCRLRKPGVNCSTISLCCVTITWRYIFKGSLQVTEVAVLPRVARLGFLTPNSANFVFLRHLTSKKLFAFLAFSFQYLDYSEAVGLWHTIRLVLWLFKCLAEKCSYDFLDSTWCIFLKRYLETHKIIKLCHIWQPIMPKVRVETLQKMWKMKV